MNRPAIESRQRDSFFCFYDKITSPDFKENAMSYL